MRPIVLTRARLLFFFAGVLVLCLFPRNVFATAKQKPTAESITHYIMGLLSDWHGLTGVAIAEYEQAAKFDENSYAIHLKLGANYARVGEFDKAVKELEKAKAINPDVEQAYYLLALIYSSLREYPKAAENYETILKKFSPAFPQNIEVYAYLGQIYYLQKKYSKSLMYFKKIEAIDSENLEVLFLIGSLHLEMNERKQAEKYFKKVLAADPNHQNSLNSLGYMYAEDGIKLDEAEKLIEHALKIEPDNGAFLDSLGWVYYKKGMYEQALEKLKEAVSLFDDPTIYNHLGDVYYKLHQPEKAKEFWQQSITLDPSQKGIEAKLKSIEKGDKVILNN